MSAVAALFSLDGSAVGPGEGSGIAAQLRAAMPQRQWAWQLRDQPVALFRALDELTPSDRNARGMATAGDWMLVGDIRLDARADLARSLGLEDREAQGFCDEQLAVLALARWGSDAIERLEGGFAIVAWDTRRRELHLWRDPNGERPLYFCRTGRRLIVASRAPILLAAERVSREVDVDGLLHFLGIGRTPGRTQLRGIEALGRAAHHCFSTANDHLTRTYWHPPDPWQWTRETIANPVAQFRSLFASVIDQQLRLQGAKGGYCSGGLDSTSIAAVAATMLAERGETYRTYTAVPHPDWREPPRSARLENDERPYVRALAGRHPNILPSYIAPDGAIFLDCLPALFERTAAPVGNPSNLVWGLAIRALQREHGVRMPFAGGGGNGSISLDSEILWDLIRAGRIGMIASEFRAAPRAFLRSSRLLAGAVRPRGPTVQPLLQFLRQGAAGDLKPRLGPAFPSLAATRIRFHDIATNSLGAGYAALERLDPTRDRRIIDFCRRLPPQEFRHGNERRRLIRRAMDGMLPDMIRLRETRGAQAPDSWTHLRARLADLREAVAFIAADPLCSALIDIELLSGLLADWSSRDSPAAPAVLGAFERTVSAGLYIRWIQDGLTELPGSRPLRYLVLDDR